MSPEDIAQQITGCEEAAYTDRDDHGRAITIEWHCEEHGDPGEHVYPYGGRIWLCIDGRETIDITEYCVQLAEEQS